MRNYFSTLDTLLHLTNLSYHFFSNCLMIFWGDMFKTREYPLEDENPPPTVLISFWVAGLLGKVLL